MALVPTSSRGETFTGGTIGDLHVDGQVSVTGGTPGTTPLISETPAGGAATDQTFYFAGETDEFAYLRMLNSGMLELANAAGQVIFRVAADGALHGRTGKSLVFDL